MGNEYNSINKPFVSISTVKMKRTVTEEAQNRMDYFLSHRFRVITNGNDRPTVIVEDIDFPSPK